MAAPRFMAISLWAAYESLSMGSNSDFNTSKWNFLFYRSRVKRAGLLDLELHPFCFFAHGGPCPRSGRIEPAATNPLREPASS